MKKIFNIVKLTAISIVAATVMLYIEMLDLDEGLDFTKWNISSKDLLASFIFLFILWFFGLYALAFMHLKNQ